MSTRLYQDGVLISDTENPEDAVWLERQRNRGQIVADLGLALTLNRNMGSQNQAILDYTAAVLADISTDTSTANLLGVVKQLANAVHTLAEHDAQALLELNYLARMALGNYSGTS